MTSKQKSKSINFSNLLIKITNENSKDYKNLLEHAKTLYSFKNMLLIVNHDFPKDHMEQIIESLDEASKNNHNIVKFVKKNNLSIEYDSSVLKKIKF